MSLERALELAERGRGSVEPTHPLVGAVLVRDGEVVGEGWYAGRGSPHAEVAALAAAGERRAGRRSTSRSSRARITGVHRRARTRSWTQAWRAWWPQSATRTRRSTGAASSACAQAGVEVEVADLWEARLQNEAWRVWIARGRPFVTYKVAMTLDGRVTVPGSRWVSGEASRRRVHELRASVDAVAVGMGTVRADDPALTARDVGAVTQPRRLAFGRGPLPEGSELELRSGPLEEELRALAADGVRSLLLEGGPTLAASFLAADLVDKLLVFVAPTLAGEGAGPVAALPEPRRAEPLDVRARRRRRAPHGLRTRALTLGRPRSTVRPASSPRRAYPGSGARVCAASCRERDEASTGAGLGFGPCSPGSSASAAASSPPSGTAPASTCASRRSETAQAAPGDSISVSGCCLTVTKADGEALEFDAVPETIARTTLGGSSPAPR